MIIKLLNYKFFFRSVIYKYHFLKRLIQIFNKLYIVITNIIKYYSYSIS